MNRGWNTSTQHVTRVRCVTKKSQANQDIIALGLYTIQLTTTTNGCYMLLQDKFIINNSTTNKQASKQASEQTNNKSTTTKVKQQQQQHQHGYQSKQYVVGTPWTSSTTDK